MDKSDRKSVQIREESGKSIPIPKTMTYLGLDARDVPTLFARAVIDGTHGIDIYDALLDGIGGYALFAWKDSSEVEKAVLLHRDKVEVLEAADAFLQELSRRQDRMRAAQG